MKKKNKKVYHESLTPANNMFLKRKWDQIRYDMHRDKVMNAKSVIDNKLPALYANVPSNLKKLQMEQERKASIEKENKILLAKISNIMNTRQRPVIAKNEHVEKSPRSLNRTRRQLDLLRIAYENQVMSKRIREKESHYCRQEWLKQWQTNRRYLANISRYSHTVVDYVDFSVKH